MQHIRCHCHYAELLSTDSSHFPLLSKMNDLTKLYTVIACGKRSTQLANTYYCKETQGGYLQCGIFLVIATNAELSRRQPSFLMAVQVE